MSRTQPPNGRKCGEKQGREVTILFSKMSPDNKVSVNICISNYSPNNMVNYNVTKRAKPLQMVYTKNIKCFQ